MSFASLRLAKPLVRAVTAKGYATATDIQAGAIPPALEGKDVLGTARTGTGKTCAFALPILHVLSQNARTEQSAKKPRQRGGRKVAPRALVLCPTRELASQIHVSCKEYGAHLPLKHAVVYGGVKQYHQVKSMRHGVDVLIATPGRLKDLVEQKIIDLSAVEIFVLDEADRMLDMGFIADIRKIESLIRKKRQTLLFSATISKSIQVLAKELMQSPVVVETAPESTPVESIRQRVIVVEQPQKVQLLAHVLSEKSVERALVFARTKHSADRIARRLQQCGFSADALHSNKSQSARNSIMRGFRSGSVQVLVATDIAARGIDVPSITHVVNFDMPIDPETYVHRIGRTARAGESGQAITFCCKSQRKKLRGIESRCRVTLPAPEKLPSMEALPQHDRSSDAKEERSARRQKRGAQVGRRSRPARSAASSGTSHKKKRYARKPRRSAGSFPYAEQAGHDDQDRQQSSSSRAAGSQKKRSRAKPRVKASAKKWASSGEDKEPSGSRKPRSKKYGKRVADKSSRTRKGSPNSAKYGKGKSSKKTRSVKRKFTSRSRRATATVA